MASNLRFEITYGAQAWLRLSAHHGPKRDVIAAVKKMIKAKPAVEGAGVRLQRAFGFGDTRQFDPFLLLDDFRNERPEDYRAGFPWHPHRGIETVTYMLAGQVEHKDSIGNAGTIARLDRFRQGGKGCVGIEVTRVAGRGRGQTEDGRQT